MRKHFKSKIIISILLVITLGAFTVINSHNKNVVDNTNVKKANISNNSLAFGITTDYTVSSTTVKVTFNETSGYDLIRMYNSYTKQYTQYQPNGKSSVTVSKIEIDASASGKVTTLSAIGYTSLSSNQSSYDLLYGGSKYSKVSEIKKEITYVPVSSSSQGSVTINDGAATTNSKNVKIKLSVPAGTTKYCIYNSNDGCSNKQDPISSSAYTTTLDHTLSVSNGETATVKVIFWINGKQQETISDTIKYSTNSANDSTGNPTNTTSWTKVRTYCNNEDSSVTGSTTKTVCTYKASGCTADENQGMAYECIDYKKSTTSNNVPSPTVNPDVYVCPASANAIKITSQIGEYGDFGNHKYQGDDGDVYYCINPGNIMPNQGCAVEESVDDVLKGDITERGRVAIFLSSASMDNKADALNLYTCSDAVGGHCYSSDRADILKAVANAVYKAFESGDTSSVLGGSVAGHKVSKTTVELLISAFTARNDENYISLENPYKLDYVEGSSKKSGENDIIASVKITGNSSTVNLKDVGNIAFTVSGKEVTSVEKSRTDVEIIYEVTIKNGNIAASSTCTPLNLNASIKYVVPGNATMLKYIVSNSQMLYGEPITTSQGTTTPDTNIPRPDCKTPNCFTGEDNYKDLYDKGQITDEEYATVCCSDPDAKSKMDPEVYKKYCDSGCENKIVAPVCDKDATEGTIIEAKELGITASNYSCLKSSKDLNGESYNQMSNAYCNVYCKEDAEYHFQGYGFNEKTGYAVYAGQYFTFKGFEGDGKRFDDLPHLKQTRTCVIDLDYKKFLTEMYGKSVNLSGVSSMSESSMYTKAGYYGLAKKAVEDYIAAVKDLNEAKDNESVATDTVAGKQRSYDICVADPKTYSNDNCSKMFSNLKTAEQELTDIKIEITDQETSRDNAKKAYETYMAKIDEALRVYKTCTTWQNDYAVSDLPTVSNFFYSDMTSPGEDVKDAIKEIVLSPKTKEVEYSSGATTYLTSTFGAGNKVDKTLFTILRLPAEEEITENTKANEFLKETESYAFFDLGKSDITAEISYGLGVELYSTIPTGNIITEKMSAYKTNSILKMGFGMPVSISTKAAKYVYSFEIKNLGKKGRLSKAMTQAMQSTQYVCNYFVGNKIICPLDSKCITCTPEESNAVGNVYNSSNLLKLNNKNSYIQNQLLGNTNIEKLATDTSCTTTTPNRVAITTGELVPFSRSVSVSSVSDAVNPLNPNNRELGENWISEEGVAAQKKIQEDGEAIYQEEPMYSFVLDSQTIRDIRSFSSTSNYLDFNLTCESGTGKYCTSSFIDDYINNDVNTARSKWLYYNSETGKFEYTASTK